jgi:hypothetical protein
MHRLQPMPIPKVHVTGVTIRPRSNKYILSRADIGVQAVRRYGSGQIGYRAMYVRIGNPVVCSIDRT